MLYRRWKKAAEQLSVIDAKLLQVTCALQRVPETIYVLYLIADKLVANGKKIMWNFQLEYSPLEIQR
jgi:hypothetical protein